MIRALLVGLAVATLLAGASAGATAPTAPKGVTGIALDGSVGLAWQPVTGADHYMVYRGTTPTAVTTPVTPAGGVTSTSFTDATAENGTSYYYAVHAATLGLESGDSLLTQSTPAARSCSSGNAIVLENCYPGTNDWKLANTPAVSAGGIEGYATTQSINRGESINLKIRTATAAPLQRVRLPERVLRRLGRPSLLRPHGPDRRRAAFVHLSRVDDRALRLLEVDRVGHRHHHQRVAVGRLHRTARPHGQRRRERDPVRGARRRRREQAALRRPVRDLRVVQQLRRQVPLRLQLDGPEHRREDAAGGQGVLRPPVRAGADGDQHELLRLVHAHRLRGGLVAGALGLRRQLPVGHRPGAERGEGQDAPGLHAGRPRRVLLRRDALLARAGAGRRRRSLQRRLRRALLEDPLREGAERRPEPRTGLLQDHLERRSGSERAHGDVARPGRREQAGERPARRDVHRRQQRRVLPAQHQRRPGLGPRVPLHEPAEPAGRVHHQPRNVHGGLGVGRPGCQRRRACRREDAGRERRERQHDPGQRCFLPDRAGSRERRQVHGSERRARLLDRLEPLGARARRQRRRDG